MAFMDKDFLLTNDTAKALFEEAKDVPIIDYHNHLSPKEIYEDRCFDNIAQVWLGGDHYKWRAMRANGISEKLITGDGAPFDKFVAWADTVQNLIGNPLYHWTHLELQRYFGITTALNPDTAKDIWDKCNTLLKTKEYSVRNLLRMQNVSVLCTTDDPADSLEWHRKIAADGFEIKVLPSFRPEKAMGIEKDGFATYIEKLGGVAGLQITDVSSLLKALSIRLKFFTDNGCRVSDHSLEGLFYVKATEAEVNKIFKKGLAAAPLTEE
ncbi:MAG: glucuronate isomerase, partial [Pseudobutyrivibrio sp.]|nr:glucuronate isomerase [Pseudobutyrivibrio sp.]